MPHRSTAARLASAETVTASPFRAISARVLSTRYPRTPAAELKLLPSVIRNPRGRKAISADSLSVNNRVWVDAMVRVLEHRLSAELGQQVWQRTGIGLPTDIDSLQARILDLEQQNLDLKIQLDERTDELEAARSANRELTKIVNQSGRTP